MRDQQDPTMTGRKSKGGFMSKTKSMLFSKFRDTRRDSATDSATSTPASLSSPSRYLYPSSPDVSVNGTHISRIQVNGNQTPCTTREKLRATSVAEDLSRVGMVRPLPSEAIQTQWRPARDVFNGTADTPTTGYLGISKALHGYGAAYRSPSRGRRENGGTPVDLTKRFEAFSVSTPNTRRNSLSENVNGNTTPSPRNGTPNGTFNGTANGTPHINGVNGKLTSAYPFLLKEFVVLEETGTGYLQAANEVVQTLEAHIAEAERLLEASEAASLSESSADALRVASGNSKLILKKKLPKFVKLIEKNNDPTKEGPPVMVDDLRGFWDMMEPDLRSIRDAFAKVERHRLNGWSPPSEPSPAATTPKKTGPKPPIPPKPRQLPPRTASVDPAALKRAAAQQKREQERAAFMKAKRDAARKALAQQNNGGEINDVASNGNGLIHH